jgi:hypothetical protein
LLLPASGGFSPVYLITTCHSTWVCAFSFSSLTKICHRIRGHPNPGWFCLDILNWMTSAKTLSPNKFSHWRFSVGASFGSGRGQKGKCHHSAFCRWYYQWQLPG